MKKFCSMLLLAVVVVCFSGCSSQRWQIQQSIYSYQLREKPDGNYSSQNTILLDARTGKTWVMIPTGEDEVATYQWVEMPRK